MFLWVELELTLPWRDFGKNTDCTEDSGESSERKDSVVLENTYIIVNRIFLKIWTLKMLLVSSHIEMRDMLLETEGKAILVIKRQRTWMNYVLLDGKKNY